MKIYIIQYPNRTEVTTLEKWELERAACKKLGITYVTRNNGVGQELVILPQ